MEYYSIKDLLEMGTRMGYVGEELQTFVKEQQTEQREARELEIAADEKTRRDMAEELARKRADEAEADRRNKEHELMLRRLELEHNGGGPRPDVSGSKAPKLPAFVDGKDQLDSYLLRFERFAASAGWERNSWATKLSALLTGKALECYSRMSDVDAVNYDKLKCALLNRYDFTEDGYRARFRDVKPESYESPEQFIVRLRTYLTKWIELSKTAKSFEGVCDLIIKIEQFINACPKDLSVFLRERVPKDLEELASVARQYLIAHDKQLAGKGTAMRSPFNSSLGRGQGRNNGNESVRCFLCNGLGHKSYECRSRGSRDVPHRQGKCGFCNKFGHEQKDCKMKSSSKKDQKVGAAIASSNQKSEKHIETGCTVHVEEKVQDGGVKNKSSADTDYLLLASGEKLPIVNGACIGQEKCKMPVLEGKVGSTVVNTLRDTGCSGVIVKKDLVLKGQYIDKVGHMLMVDRTVRKVPMARIEIKTQYLCGEVEALCVTDPIYDLIIGNIPGARRPEDPDVLWDKDEVGAVTTRAQAKRKGEKTPLHVSEGKGGIKVDREELIRLQRADESLEKYYSMKDVKVKDGKKTSFEEKNKVLYRMYQHPDTQHGKVTRQVVVPRSLRQRVMEVAHNSIMGGHMGVKKTVDRIISNFYWPGLQQDVTHFCRSCDVCQKTVHKGTVPKAPLEKMPLIDMPFKRVAVDLVGPIAPPSEEGHRYILTLVDFATRYPQAVPLKTITTEAVAEALVNLYSRIGIPEEILSDMGTQFVSECMEEVSRLLSIRRLTSSPYHPMCNGLVEKFNGTLKMMLKRLCSEQPRQWHRYINPLLFAYREVPQESTGFAPFELLYGRTVHGPMNILKELWTKEVDTPEVMNSYQYVLELRERLEDTLKIAQEELRKSQTRYKKYFDRKTKIRKYQPGEKVLILLPTDSNKLLMQWKGPYEIEDVVRNNDYKVKVDKKVKIYHVNMLKRYIQREPSDEPNINQEEVAAGADCILIDLACSSIIEACEQMSEETINDDELLDLGTCVAKESTEDIKYGSNLTNTQRQVLQDIVNSYNDVFTDLPGSTNLVEHKVKLTCDEPVRSKPYAIPYFVRESLKDDIADMLRMGIIRESTSPYASPVVIVRKKDGSNRICIDYRKLNKLTIFDPEPMVAPCDLFQKLSGSKFLTKIDLSKGYWQVPVAKEDVLKTAFITPDGKYEFLKMPFGMMNSGATLVRGIRKLLAGISMIFLSIPRLGKIMLRLWRNF